MTAAIHAFAPASPRDLLTPADRAAIASIAGRASIRQMTAEASAASGIPVSVLLGKSRWALICRVREVIWFRAWAEGFSLGQIGRVFRRDHTTVMSGIRNEERRRGHRARPVIANGQPTASIPEFSAGGPLKPGVHLCGGEMFATA